MRQRDERVERLGGGAGVERLLGAADARLERVGAARDVDRAAGVAAAAEAVDTGAAARTLASLTQLTGELAPA